VDSHGFFCFACGAAIFRSVLSFSSFSSRFLFTSQFTYSYLLPSLLILIFKVPALVAALPPSPTTASDALVDSCGVYMGKRKSFKEFVEGRSVEQCRDSPFQLVRDGLKLFACPTLGHAGYEGELRIRHTPTSFHVEIFCFHTKR